ncbi:hypothetical protein KSP39_PZI014675 [Platanthera zijinensis]|uniref:Remorin n=1 Tax=Platanthera zijinensis TaxID=2320716 RepID=A0AAP0G2F7_9ASPA
MGQEDLTKVDDGGFSKEAAPPAPPVKLAKGVAEENLVFPSVPMEKSEDLKSPAAVEKVADPYSTGKGFNASSERDSRLARLESEKKISLIKAWEESEKAKAENKAVKMMATITAWENSKKAAMEAELKKMEEAVEKKKAEYAEKMKNKIAANHKKAEENRAMVEARRSKDLFKADDMAAKYRGRGLAPKKLFGSFRGM